MLQVAGKDSLVSCESAPIVPLDAKDLFTVIPSVTYIAFDAATGGFEVPTTLNYTGTKTLFIAAKTTATGCLSIKRVKVTLIIQAAPPAPRSKGDISECAKNPLQTLNAGNSITPVAGMSVVWYDALVGGKLVASPTFNTPDKSITYYAENVNNATKCTSLTRTAVKLSLSSSSASAASNSPVSLGQTLLLKGGTGSYRQYLYVDRSSRILIQYY